MGRPREFDTDTALQGAMEIFWRQGYLATNLPDLLEAMGLTRGSFYKAFKDKETAYLAALDFYDAAVVSTSVQALQICEAPEPQDCLALLFAPARDPRRGCFICNAMVELAPDNPRVAEKANAMANRLRAAILEVLSRTASQTPARDNAATADLILHLYFGFQAMGKAGDTTQDWLAHLHRLLDDG